MVVAPDPGTRRLSRDRGAAVVMVTSSVVLVQDRDERPDDVDGDGDGRGAGGAGLATVLPFPTVRPTSEPAPDPGLRTVIGDVLREERQRQERTLADVAAGAAVSLPYLSEVERGRKEISSDLLGSVCDALDLTLVEVLERCVGRLRAGAQGGPRAQLRAA